MIGCDAAGPLDITPSGNRFLIVAVDYLTKWPIALPVKCIDRRTTAQFLFDKFVCRHGVPNYLLTDRGSNFTSGFVKDSLNAIQCKHLTTTAYRSQVNGLCERLNQTLVQTLAKICLQQWNTSNWDVHLNQALMAIRTMPSDVSLHIPARLLYGYEIHAQATWPAPRQDYVEGDISEELVSRIK
jgi:hypothetical protein